VSTVPVAEPATIRLLAIALAALALLAHQRARF
jgi:hypothetical protein